MTDVEKTVEGSGNFEYLTRSVAIVTLLYERGILQELFDSGRITQDEIDIRLQLIQERFSAYAPEKMKSDAAAPQEEPQDDGTE